jgi:predicted ATPase
MADSQSSPTSTQPIPPASFPAADAERLASCLALLTQKSPDLALLVESWDQLPDAVRAGIVAMVKAAVLS